MTFALSESVEKEIRERNHSGRKGMVFIVGLQA